MCVVLANPDRPAWQVPTTATDTEVRSAFDGLVAYCGTYETDERRETVIHHVEADREPHMMGTDRARLARVSGDRLVLRPTSLPPGVAEWTVEWERVRATRGWIRTASGLEYRVVTEGRGRVVARGDTVTIHEALSLPDGRTVFDSRVAPNKPVTFTLGANQVIRGVDEGVTGMRVGERRRLRVPAALDGRAFDPAFIPPTATRLYDIEVLAARP